MTVWQPLSEHLSQLRLNPDGSYTGDDDCGPVCDLRLLREAGKIDPHGDRLAQLDDFRQVIDGHPDEQGQGGTSFGDCERYLARFGVDTTWTASFDVAQASQFALVLVTDAPRLDDGSWPYPSDWLGGQEHWILWLPRWQGSGNWFNDPLTYTGGERDTQLDLNYLRGIFAGAILAMPLPPIGTGVPAGRPGTRALVLTARACALKTQPNHHCTALARIPALGQCLDLIQRQSTDGETWARVQWRDRTGWLPAAYLQPIPLA